MNFKLLIITIAVLLFVNEGSSCTLCLSRISYPKMTFNLASDSNTFIFNKLKLPVVSDATFSNTVNLHNHVQLTTDENNSDCNSSPKESVKDLMLQSIRWYRNTLSPIMPPNCRFLPSCSNYALEAIDKFGPQRGFILTAWRIMRCNPIGGSGYDPPIWPPPSFNSGSNSKTR